MVLREDGHRWVAGSRTADTGGTVASRIVRPQMLILMESSKITKKMGCWVAESQCWRKGIGQHKGRAIIPVV